jgi:ribosome biogenesis GTPase A
MKISSNIDFFEKPLSTQTVVTSPQNANKESDNASVTRKRILLHTSGEVAILVKQTSEALTKCGLPKMATRVEKILNDAAKERFVVAIVGEFNRGKSTFINNLLEKNIELPVGNLPTTAVMTRIRYAQKPKMAVFDDKGTRVGLLDVNQNSWDGLVVKNFSEEQPKGSVIVGIPNKWLGQNSIELIDCPGAGDLSEERTQQIIDALDRADAAIININATAALSLTEKEFILQRILKRKTPFAMIIVNKLDLVRKEERNGIIKYIKDVLVLNKMNIPFYIPSDVEMTDDTYAYMQGLDAIRSVISGWAADPKRQALTDLWIKARVLDVVFMAIDALKEQQKIYYVDNEHSQEVIQGKKNELAKLDLLWGELELNMQNRSNSCYKTFIEKVEEYKANIIERLQYEAGHAGSPEKWWKEDYPYRLKVELANLSVGLDNVISHLISSDARWFNQMLDQRFKFFVQVESTNITEKTDYISEKSNRKIEFEDLSRKQNVARLGTTALCIASYFTPLGFMGSMGIGAGGAILQNSFFKKKIEEQKSILKNEIAKDIPLIIDKATIKSEQRIQFHYNSIIEESSKKKELWIETQTTAIEANDKPKSAEAQKQVCSYISELETISSKLN